MTRRNNKAEGATTKPASAKKEKIFSTAPLSGRFSRSEGAKPRGRAKGGGK
ncbi:MAG TPA: hypothetical protein VF796_15790 [Humisphaera sp.]